MTKYNYVTQEQLNSIMAEFIKNGGGQTFDDFFETWAKANVPELRAPLTRLSPVQHTFVANVLTILNQAGV